MSIQSTSGNKLNKVRDHRMDNIRFILMFLVVFGHMLETFPGAKKEIIYLIIYAFHMPAFIFLTGYFSRFSLKKLLKHLVVPYIVFQILYLLFAHYVLDPESTLSIQFTTPYWILWYLLAAIVYSLLGAVLKTDKVPAAVIILIISIVLSLGAGFFPRIGYFLSLSRIIVFLPFFLLGLYSAGPLGRSVIPAFSGKGKRAAGTVVCIAGAVICEYLILKLHVPAAALYGSYNYAATGTGAGIRFLASICAFFCIFALVFIIPNVYIPFITKIGRNTLAIYLLHGFLMRLIAKAGVFHYTENVNIILSAVAAFVILAVLGSPPVGYVFKKLF